MEGDGNVTEGGVDVAVVHQHPARLVLPLPHVGLGLLGLVCPGLGLGDRHAQPLQQRGLGPHQQPVHCLNLPRRGSYQHRDHHIIIVTCSVVVMFEHLLHGECKVGEAPLAQVQH